jgi:hypothetical protein
MQEGPIAYIPIKKARSILLSLKKGFVSTRRRLAPEKK